MSCRYSVTTFERQLAVCVHLQLAPDGASELDHEEFKIVEVDASQRGRCAACSPVQPACFYQL